MTPQEREQAAADRTGRTIELHGPIYPDIIRDRLFDAVGTAIQQGERTWLTADGERKAVIAPAGAHVLPVTASGTPSYSLAKTRIKGRVDDLLFTFQEEYGLTDLEVADVLADIMHGFLRGAVSDQQEESEAPRGAIGTPQQA